MAGLERRGRVVYRAMAAAVLVAGCEPVTYVPREELLPAPQIEPRYATVAGPSGKISGRVAWIGVVPAVPPFRAAKGVGGTLVGHAVPNPFLPQVDPATRGLGGAAVFLRGVDPGRAGPWRHPPVTVEMKADRLAVNGRGVGFVPVGAEVQFVSKEPSPQMIRGRGAAFFSFALPEPDKPRKRTFNRPGRVELSSGAGQFWAQADLFACEHPYCAATNERGEFELNDVPPGKYELVVWHRSWWPAWQERDPDTGLVARMGFAEPVEKKQWVTVDGEKTAAVNESFDLHSFPMPSNHPATK